MSPPRLINWDLSRKIILFQLSFSFMLPSRRFSRIPVGSPETIIPLGIHDLSYLLFPICIKGQDDI